jgi:Protein of unknown function (DUF2804)
VDRLPQRGTGVRTLSVPVPPAKMPLRRGARPLKRWRYIGAYSPELMVCVGSVRVGPMPQHFWAVAERGGALAQATTIRRGGVSVDGPRAQVETGDVSIDLTVDEGGGVESVHSSGRDGYVWTRKQAGVPVTGRVSVHGRTYTLDCEGGVDDTAGYHQRHTSWRWSIGVGRGADGEHVAWNLVTGVNDSHKDSERAIWIDGEAFEPEPVAFSDDLTRIAFGEGGELVFEEWSAREDRTNLLLVRSFYRQPFGTFTGSLPGGVQLVQGYGVVEVHDVSW